MVKCMGQLFKIDMAVGKIKNILERGFVKHRLNCLLITDPMTWGKKILNEKRNHSLA